MKIIRWFYSLIFKKPSTRLSWTVSDFRIARGYCLTQPHPFKPNSTLWNFLRNRDSVEILDYVNRELCLND